MTQTYVEKMVVDINNTPIARDDMLALIESLGDLVPEDRDMEGHMIHCVAFFDGGEKAFSAHFRLMGLYRLVESENLPGWASNTLPDGSRRLHGALFVAAGLAPVRLDGEKISLDREPFLRLVFQEAKPEVS